MAQREGSIYLYLFIAASVLFLGMTVLFFLGSAEKEEISAERDKHKAKIAILEDAVKKGNDEIKKLRELIGGPDVVEQFPEATYRVDELKNKAETAINETRKDLGEAAVEYTYLTQPYGDTQSLLTKLRQARDEAFKARDAANDAQVKLKAATDEQIAALREAEKNNLQQIQELQAKYEDLDNKFKTEKAEWVKEIEKIKDEASDTQIALNRTINWKDNTIGNLNSRIDRLEAERNKEKGLDDIEADGKLVSLLSSSGKGWIDLGRVHHLRNGLVFRVFQHIKGGKKLYKGRVEVSKVDETMSEVRILEESDDLNPIVGGDFISSPFYDPKVQPVFVFAGNELETKDLTKEGLVSKMKSYGAQIKDKVDLKADFLVAMKNFESTPEYKAARELGVTIIRERDLLEFIGR